MTATRTTWVLVLSLVGCLPEEASDPFLRQGPAPDSAADSDAADAGDPAPDATTADGAIPPDAAPVRDPVARPAECGADLEFTAGPGASDETVGAGALVDARIQLQAGSLAEVALVTVGCDADLVREGFTAVGPAMRALGPQALPLAKSARITWVFDATRLGGGVEERHLRLFWKPDNAGYVAEPPLVNAEVDLIGGTVTFDTPGLGTFQLGHIDDAGTPVQRRFTFRALAGISMGGGAAAYLGPKYADQFDLVIPLGGPVDWPYLLNYITQRVLGGFCTAQDGEVGTWCGLPESERPREVSSDYKWWYYEEHGGNDFDRDDYLQLFQDLSYAYGNMAFYNPDSPYLPPGMPPSNLARPDHERCAAECRGDECAEAEASFTIAEGFYDDEYNPDGAFPVISYCDGRDSDPRGRWADEPHRKPTEAMLAVDVNGNGRRDADEPVLRNLYEPFDDVGCDATASADEPGYDPVTNPDPAGDDYDWYRNPTGTEGNWMHDCTEPYRDIGIDGVAGTPQFADGGFDHGEGNGAFDYNPNYERFLDRTGGLLFQKLPVADRERLRFWSDAGNRDLFNFSIAHDQLMGRIQAGGHNVRVFDTFDSLFQGDIPTDPYVAIPTNADPFGDRGQSVYVRYGKAEPSEVDIVMGDGAHVGTIAQAINRFMTFFDWVHNRWPDGDYSIVEPPFEFEQAVEFFHSERFGKQFRYAVVLPPGYSRPENAAVRYPVVIVMHGYGQGPEDLPVTGPILANAMKDGAWQKSVVVFPEGFCGKASVYQCNDGVDNDGDGMLDAANDQEQRVACETDDDCRGTYICRDTAVATRFCCPPEWTDCGAPDPTCEFNRKGRQEGEQPLSLCSDGVDNDLDGLTDLDDEGCMGQAHLDDEADCKKGSFYTTHVAKRDGTPGGPDYEGGLLDMLDHLDANYRTRAPETITVPK